MRYLFTIVLLITVLGLVGLYISLPSATSQGKGGQTAGGDNTNPGLLPGVYVFHNGTYILLQGSVPSRLSLMNRTLVQGGPLIHLNSSSGDWVAEVPVRIPPGLDQVNVTVYMNGYYDTLTLPVFYGKNPGVPSVFYYPATGPIPLGQ